MADDAARDLDFSLEPKRKFISASQRYRCAEGLNEFFQPCNIPKGCHKKEVKTNPCISSTSILSPWQ